MRIIEASGPASGLAFAIVVAKYNDFVTDRLQKGAVEALVHHGVKDEDITIIRVPGAFEIPAAARLANITPHSVDLVDHVIREPMAKAIANVVN